MLLGTIQPTAAEIAAHHTMKDHSRDQHHEGRPRSRTLDLPLQISLVNFLPLRSTGNKYRLFYVIDTVSLVALPDHFGVTMLLFDIRY